MRTSIRKHFQGKIRRNAGISDNQRQIITTYIIYQRHFYSTAHPLVGLKLFLPEIDHIHETLKLEMQFPSKEIPYLDTKQLYWNHTSAWVLSSICCIISEHLSQKTPLDGCFWMYKTPADRSTYFYKASDQLTSLKNSTR